MANKHGIPEGDFSVEYVDMDQMIVIIDNGMSLQVVMFMDEDGYEAEDLNSIATILCGNSKDGYFEIDVDLSPVTYH